MHMVAYRNYCMSTVLDGSLGSIMGEFIIVLKQF